MILTDQSSGQVWSYTNVHGDVTATANASGVKQGTTATYDPYGNALGGTKPDNSPGNMDNQWLGGAQRLTEHASGLAPIVEMGARQYDPTTGRFLSVDPVPGGSANQYDYTAQDPINGLDLDGRSVVFGSWHYYYLGGVHWGPWLGMTWLFGWGTGAYEQSRYGTRYIYRWRYALVIGYNYCRLYTDVQHYMVNYTQFQVAWSSGPVVIHHTIYTQETSVYIYWYHWY